jgi:NAD(P)-dependent dehydrogenase (short-subunit alcohol dehydrogenase family)
MTTDEKMAGKLEGRIALVTGGTSGIGLATAKRFVAEGAYVFITGRREKELALAVKSIGGSVTGVQGDVSQIGDLERLFAQIKQEKGRLDIVFANAGTAKYAPLGEITEEFFDSIFDVNVKGLLFTVQSACHYSRTVPPLSYVRRWLPARDCRRTASTALPRPPCAQFARTWTTDLRSRRIRVNAVSPGSTETPGLNELLGSSETGQQRLKMISNIVPLGRLGNPDEIANAVVFLASDDASYVTGAELFVDGGFAQV